MSLAANSCCEEIASEDTFSEKVDARDLLTLTKPNIVWYNALCAVIGYWTVAKHPVLSPAMICVFLGTGFAVASANALNMIIERHSDRLMKRTRNRPLASGKLSVAVALVFGISLAVLSCVVLALGCNPLTATIGLFAIVSYALVYTPMKRLSAWSMFVGAVPGAIPPVLGCVAAAGYIETSALLLFAIFFAWQLAHFVAVSIYLDQDYNRAGIKTVARSMSSLQCIVLAAVCVVLIIPCNWALYYFGFSGAPYAIIMSLFCLFWLGAGLRKLSHSQGAASWRYFFVLSLIYPPVWLVSVLLDQVL